MLCQKYFLKNKKYIVLMYLSKKNILKNNRYYTIIHSKIVYFVHTLEQLEFMIYTNKSI